MSQSNKKFWYANIYPSLVPKGLNADDQIIMQKIYFESKTMKGSKGFSFSSFSSFAERLKHKSPQSVAVRISELVEKGFLIRKEIDDVEISYKKIGYAPSKNFLELYEPMQKGSFIKYTSLHADAGITPAMAVFMQTVKNESLPTFTQLCGKFYEYCGQQTAKNRNAGKNDTRQGYRFLNSDLEISAPNENIKFKDFFDRSAPQEVGVGAVVTLSKKGYAFQDKISESIIAYHQTIEGNKFMQHCDAVIKYVSAAFEETYKSYLINELKFIANTYQVKSKIEVDSVLISNITGLSIGSQIDFSKPEENASFANKFFEVIKNEFLESLKNQNKIQESNFAEFSEIFKKKVSDGINFYELDDNAPKKKNVSEKFLTFNVFVNKFIRPYQNIALKYGGKSATAAINALHQRLTNIFEESFVKTLAIMKIA